MAMTKQEKLDKKAEALYEKKHKKRYRKSIGDWTFDILNHAFFAIFTLACIFPFYYIFINTISNNDLVRKGAINFIPQGIHFKNYMALTSVNDVGTALQVTERYGTDSL